MADESFLTDAVRALVGRETAPRQVRVEPLALKRLMDALGDTRPLSLEPGAPAPAYATTLLEQGDDAVELPAGPASSLVAGDEWEFVRPLRVAERLTVTAAVTDAYERFGGRFGQMLYLRYEWTYRAEDGAVVARARRIMARYEAGAEERDG